MGSLKLTADFKNRTFAWSQVIYISSKLILIRNKSAKLIR